MRSAHWQPFQERMDGLVTMQQRMNRMFSDMFGENGEDGVESAQNIDWAPRMDIVEIDGKLEIQVELAGMNKEDVRAEIEDNVLTISGERSPKDESQNRKMHLNERSYGSFRRAFQIPLQFNREKIAASFDKGILTVSLDRVEKENPREIPIATS